MLHLDGAIRLQPIEPLYGGSSHFYCVGLNLVVAARRTTFGSILSGRVRTVLATKVGPPGIVAGQKQSCLAINKGSLFDEMSMYMHQLSAAKPINKLITITPNSLTFFYLPTPLLYMHAIALLL